MLPDNLPLPGGEGDIVWTVVILAGISSTFILGMLIVTLVAINAWLGKLLKLIERDRDRDSGAGGL